LRLHLIKLGAQVTETVSRVRLAFADACPEADLLAAACRLMTKGAGPDPSLGIRLKAEDP
jgi:hypothetical protein